MYELKIFEGNTVEVIEHDGLILFNPYHVGKCLDMADETVRDHMRKMNGSQAVMLKNSNVGLTNIRKLHNTGEKFLTESGVYKLVFKSRKPTAEKFTDWVTDEVLPTIRKTGGYVSDDELFIETYLPHADESTRLLFATTLKTVRKQNERIGKLEAHVEEKSLQLDESKQYYTVKRVAKMNRIDWRSISWKRLKNTSEYLQLEVKKVFDANFGTVNSYHLDVWLYEYPELDNETKPTLRLAV